MANTIVPTMIPIERSAACTRWEAKWPSTPFKASKSYRVTTYPDSDLLFIETWVKRRQVSSLVARDIAAAVRKALAEQFPNGGP